jgi:glycosyltransferase involved in cell wall biosynthesis
MNNYTFGFLLSVYKNDNPSYIDQCLSSIANQTLPADETIIVVEGDIKIELKNIISNYSDKIKKLKVFFIEQQKGPLNYGLPSSLNYGLANSDVDYIVRIDSDDINCSSRIEETSNFLKKNPEIKLLGSNVEEYDETMLIKQNQRSVPEKHIDILKFSKFRNPFNGPAVTFDRLTAIKLGGYPQVASNEDYCLWVSFLKYDFPTYNLQKNLVKMRGDIGIIKRRSSLRYVKGEWQAMRYMFGIGYFSFLLYIFHIVSKTFIRLLLPTNLISKLYSKFFRT